MNSRFVEKRKTPTQEETLDLTRRALELALERLQTEIAALKEWQTTHECEARPLLDAVDEIVGLANNLKWLTTTRKWVILAAGAVIGAASVAAVAYSYHHLAFRL